MFVDILVWIANCMLYFSITRTFASGRTEKMIMQCLKDLGFASGKVCTTAFFVAFLFAFQL